ncbi:MAG: hypothetical protein H7174_08430 [Flavobacterium sp.]|nr:hypothetical protein [Flavobacterium sp.]
MILIPHKTKQFLVQLIKILVVVGAFYFIYDELINNDKLNWQQFLIIFKKNQSFLGLLFILFLSFLNRFFEIIKWQNLVSFIKPITVFESTKQVLAALTLGVFTPVGIGEYAGKALYFDKSKTSEIVFLNLICNGIQMVTTTFFGLIGMFFLGYYLWTFGIIFIGIIVVLLFVLTKNKKIKGYTIQDFITKINSIPNKIHKKNLFLGISRYLVFTHQYYFLLLAFDVNITYLELISTITMIYFLSSIVPSFQFLDFALKGSLAIYFFKILGVNEWIVVFIISLMWFLNVAIPVIIGSFFVLNFKLQSNE